MIEHFEYDQKLARKKEQHSQNTNHGNQVNDFDGSSISPNRISVREKKM